MTTSYQAYILHNERIDRQEEIEHSWDRSIATMRAQEEARDARRAYELKRAAKVARHRCMLSIAQRLTQGRIDPMRMRRPAKRRLLLSMDLYGIQEGIDRYFADREIDRQRERDRLRWAAEREAHLREEQRKIDAHRRLRQAIAAGHIPEEEFLPRLKAIIANREETA